MINEIITGNNVEILREMAADSIDLTVTSPPYDNLRTYNGYSFDFEGLAQELYRVTKPGGVVVWVVGDKTDKGSETGTSFRQVLFFKEVGFNLNDTMIYQKDTTFGTAGKGSLRYAQEFEYMFILTKGKPKAFNPIMVPCKHAGGTFEGSTRKNRQSDGKAFDEKRELVNPKVSDSKRKGNIWLYGVGIRTTKDKIAFQHPAIFPDKLAEDHITSWSNPGDIVLDPFGGSGTTAKMALKNGRQFIHIDISEEYNEIARKRIEGVDANGLID